MTIKKLTNNKALQFLNSYEDCLSQVLNQYDNREDSILLQHIITNIHSINRVLQIESSSNKLSWQIMTFFTGVPQVLSTTSTHVLQYDTEYNINKNFEQLYNSLLLNNKAAIEHLKKHMDGNEKINIIALFFMIASIFLSCAITPGSPLGVSFLFPLSFTVAVPLILSIIVIACVGIQLLSSLHARTLREIHHRHLVLEESENEIRDQDGFLGHHKSIRFFQPGNHENGMLMLTRVKESFDARDVAFAI